MFFISLEGLDCSGKTTIIKQIQKKLTKNNYDTFVTREPGGNNISEKIREIILSKNNSDMDYWTEALLYIASRSQHLQKVIIPSLKQNKIVLCDRFLDSTTAYQGSGRKIPTKDLDTIQKLIIGDYLPNLTLFLDINIETMKNRLALRNYKEKNRLDLEDIEFYKRVQKGYYDILENNKKRIVKVNANLDIKKVVEICYKEIIKILNSKSK